MSQQIPTILVVEDDVLLLEAITKKLKLNEMNPIGCPAGQEALAILQNNTILPDAIWLDYHLKDMDGITFMAQLKENPAWINIPVVVVSNSASTDNVHSMLTLGAKQYLLKAEHRLEDIVDAMKKLIQDESKTV